MQQATQPVQRMSCENCGAPLKLEPERHFLFCEYCSALYFPKESPDGMALLGEPANVPCPICRIPLTLARIGEFLVLTCEQCKGILFDLTDFLPTLEYLRLRYPERRRPPAAFNSKELERGLRCPHCESKMETFPYSGPGNVVVDNCITCGILWLDYDEINRIVQTPERRREQDDWLDITSIEIKSENDR